MTEPDIWDGKIFVQLRYTINGTNTEIRGAYPREKVQDLFKLFISCVDQLDAEHKSQVNINSALTALRMAQPYVCERGTPEQIEQFESAMKGLNEPHRPVE